MIEYMETEYIKKPVMKIAVKSYFKHLINKGKYKIDVNDANADVNRIISEIPAADVVEVVRCKDCVHCVKRKFDNFTEYECGFFDIFVDLQEYCCKGERKTDNDI